MHVLFYNNDGRLLVVSLGTGATLEQMQGDAMTMRLFIPSFHNSNHTTFTISLGSPRQARAAWQHVRRVFREGGSIDLTDYQSPRLKGIDL